MTTYFVLFSYEKDFSELIHLKFDRKKCRQLPCGAVKYQIRFEKWNDLNTCSPEHAEKDELFEEITQVNSILEKIPTSDFLNDSPETKWMKIFAGKDTLPCIYQIVSFILSIPVSNAFVERVFSLCDAQWTKRRNSLEVRTIKALLQTRVNFDIPCCEMFNLLMEKPELRKKIAGMEKYEY